ncbi:hypothetical protein GC387_37125 [Pseudomonas sp. MWU12-2323]|nr:hypothetical protein [Pseudomonas sp. MWU12-2323]
MSRAIVYELEVALHAWPAYRQGNDVTFAAGYVLRIVAHTLAWLSLSPADTQSELEPTSEGENDAGAATSDPTGETAEHDSDLQFEICPRGDQASDFMDALDRLAGLGT